MSCSGRSGTGIWVAAFAKGILVGLGLAIWAETSAEEVAGSIRLGTDAQPPLWVGQQITLNLDLLTTGFSFSEQRFLLPDVQGGFLMQTDSTTVKLTERNGAETWQVLRYPIALFPQRRGRLIVPAFEVRFRAAAGFGGEPREFAFRTEPLTLQIELPPGADEDGLLVTTTRFDVRVVWSPPLADDEEGRPVAIQTGDAVTLRVTQSADDISGMVLPALPVISAPGMAAYPATPVVSDRVERGTLRGSRADAVTWMFERPGRYDVPEVRYRWFDPVAEELKERRVAGRSFEVRSPDGRTSEESAFVSWNSASPLYWLAAAGVSAGLAGLIGWWAVRRGSERRQMREPSEAALLERAVKACRRNDPRGAYSALLRWAGHRAGCEVSLVEYAAGCDPAFRKEAEGLQQALIVGRAWNGAVLARVLIRVKRARQPADSGSGALRPLNPDRN